jgi:hypothetical protein
MTRDPLIRRPDGIGERRDGRLTVRQRQQQPGGGKWGQFSGLTTFRAGFTRYLCTSPAFVPTHRRVRCRPRRKARYWARGSRLPRRDFHPLEHAALPGRTVPYCSCPLLFLARCQGRQCPRLLLPPPGRQVRGVQPFPAQQGAEIARLAAIGLPQDLQLVLGAEAPTLRALHHLRVRGGRGRPRRAGSRSACRSLVILLPAATVNRPGGNVSPTLAQRATCSHGLRNTCS